MANIKLNLTAAPFTGQIVTFCAPCSCADVSEGLVINGEIYTVCDAMGVCVTGVGGAWCEGAAVSVALDVESKKAYLQNTTAIASNENLLDNWYFADPVNQRGQTEYTGAGYTIDRWKIYGRTLTFNSAGITITTTDGTDRVDFQQFIDSHVVKGMLGHTVTISILVDGEMYSATGQMPNETVTATVVAKVPISNSKTLLLRFANNGVVGFYIDDSNLTKGESYTIKAAKLELGNKQTLAHKDESGNWILNDLPPNKALELLKCCMSTADSSDTYANNKLTSAAVNAVNKAGDTMTGSLAINNGYGRLSANNTTAQYEVINTPSDNSNRRILTIKGSATGLKSAVNLVNVVAGNATNYTLYGEHNKPRGSYTGNGSATSRTITTDGYGKAIVIFSATGVVLVTPSGGFYGYSNSSFGHFPSETAAFNNGVLTIASTHTALNTNGQTYQYQVL